MFLPINKKLLFSYEYSKGISRASVVEEKYATERTITSIKKVSEGKLRARTSQISGNPLYQNYFVAICPASIRDIKRKSAFAFNTLLL